MEVLIPIVAFVSVLCVSLYLLDRRILKEGHCNEKWVHYDTDSQGCWCLRCSKCDVGSWVSWYKNSSYTVLSQPDNLIKENEE